MAVYSSTLQQEVDDVWQPQQVENTGNAEEHCGIALVRTSLLTWFRVMRSKPGPALADLPGVLTADAEDVGVGEADGEGCGSIECCHDEGGEEWLGGPGRRAPLNHIPMVPGFTPAKKRRQEDKGRVKPDESNAGSQTARCHQGRVGQWPGDSYIAVHANTS